MQPEDADDGAGPSGTEPDINQRLLNLLGKKLLCGKSPTARWSLMERSENSEIFEDMGVSLLENNIVNKSENEINDQENIENHSPNLQRCLKRSYSKAQLSPLSKISPLKENVFNNENVSEASFTKISKVSYDRKPTLANSSNQNDSHKKNKSEPNSSQGETCSKFNDSKNYKLLSNDLSNETIAQSDLVQMSPLTTCGAHPSLHKYPKFIPRHATFDENNPEINNFSQSSQLNNDEIFDQTVDEIDESGVKLASDSTNRIYFEENCIISANIVNLSDDLSADDTIPCNNQITEENSSVDIVEKECFVSQDVAVCKSCEKKEVSECTSACRDNKNGFSKLFDEVVLSIFHWLPKKTLVRCMLVCKRWNRLAMNSRLWARVCLGGRVLNSGVLPTLMSRHPIVLRLANAQLISPVLPNKSIGMEWRVQFLDLSAASISPECLGSILHRCPALLRLSLEGLTLSESACVALGKLSQLKVLNLALTVGLGLTGARALSFIPRLEALNVAWTGLDAEAVNVLCGGLPSTLQRLNISGFRKTLTEKTVQVIVSRCPKILELDLSDCIMLGEGLMPILQNLKSLEHLALSRCNRLRQSDFLLMNNFSSLQWVDIFGLIPTIMPIQLSTLHSLLPKIKFNQFIHSAIARPTVGNRRTSIWGLRTRD